LRRYTARNNAAHRGDYSYDFTRVSPDDHMSTAVHMPNLPIAADTVKPGSVSMWVKKQTSFAGREALFVIHHADVQASMGRTHSGGADVDWAFSNIELGMGLNGASDDGDGDGDANVPRLFMRVTDGYGTVVCDVWSGPLARLTDGSWHNVAFVMESDPRSRPIGLAAVHFYVDASHGFATCKLDATRDETDMNATASGAVWANPLRWSNAFVGGASHGANSTTSALIGARYAAASGDLNDLLDATVDDVMFVARALEPNEVKLLASAMPCAKGYHNDGYAYFPDTPAIHGPEYVLWDNVPACGEGPHTVTFRYLQSMGNNKHMLLGGRGGDTPVHFYEPDSFASADTFTWAHTDPVVVDMAGGVAELYLSSMSTDDLQRLPTTAPARRPPPPPLPPPPPPPSRPLPHSPPSPPPAVAEIDVGGQAARLGYKSRYIRAATFDVMEGNSNIATVNDFNFITDAINTGEKMTDMWVKCYDSETDTHDAATFHTNCNNRGATVTLVMTTGNRKVAAFNPLSYNSGARTPWVNAPEALLINLHSKRVNRFFQLPWAAVVDRPTQGPSHGYDYGTNAGPFWVQDDMTTVKCDYWDYNFPRAGSNVEMSSCAYLLGGAHRRSTHEAQYLEVWALKTTSTVTVGGSNSSIASQEDFVRMTNAIRRFRPSLERSEHDSVTPVPGMWEKCFDSTAPPSVSTAPGAGPKVATYRGDEQSKIVDNDEIDWIVGEISADFGSPLTALVHKCYDRDVHALTSQEWHARCNTFGATLTFIELTNGMKLAIFLPDSMDGKTGYQQNWTSSSVFIVNGNGRNL